MSFSESKLNDIYDRTDGRCHICRKRLAFSNYGVVGARGAWEIDHSKARSRGGTHHGNNLYPACISCNRSKQALGSRAARARAGFTKAPMSRAAQDKRRNSNAWKGIATGVSAGALFGGPVGALLGGIAGAVVGNARDPES